MKTDDVARDWREHGLPINAGPRLHAAGLITATGAARCDELVVELEALLDADRADVFTHFMTAARTWDDYRDRYATWRLLEQHRRPKPPRPPARPTGAALEPVDPRERRRPLTDIEIGLVRFTGLHRRTQRVTDENRRSLTQIALIGLLDAGCTTNELCCITPDHVDFDPTGIATTVRSPGATSDGRRAHPAAAPRHVPIPDWCQPAVTTLTATTPTSGVLVDPTAATPHSSAERHTVHRRIVAIVDDVLVNVGLAGDPAVDPASIRNTAGRAHYLAHGLEAAGRLLGDHDPNRLLREIGVRPHLPRRTT